MSVLKVDFPAADGALNLNRTNRIADFEDIIRLDFRNPPQWIRREPVTSNLKPSPSEIAESETIHIHDRTRSFESSIVPFRRSDRRQSFDR
ncbi:hypothetical protein IQ235_10025 [Oscillatoriales cyanobacterium LEGE 11467]|uniref:Uncharacterized protein n=1 Tax=Zarconia navalis LEGE 11467 TaxID=1828826 RepID=A0A928W0M5_9CYAN|nr:hypothetical protein [Zarconia navalis]MBE9041115.1 hypothetical protein [Zarconia navalis LEGE 11467]